MHKKIIVAFHLCVSHGLDTHGLDIGGHLIFLWLLQLYDCLSELRKSNIKIQRSRKGCVRVNGA